MDIAVLILVPLLLIVLIEMGRRWRATVMLVMVFMVFEGAFRKWLFPSLQGPIYFVKDAMLMVAIVGYVVENQRSQISFRFAQHINLLLLLTCLFCLLQLANPNSPSPLLGILGAKNYLLYAALFFMVPQIFRSIEDLDCKLKIYMLVMIPVAALGIVQFMLPAEHWINTQVAHDVNKEMFVSRFGEDDRARASGTFSYIGGFATFIQAMMVLSAAFVLSGERLSARLRWAPIGLLLASTLGMFATGSRSTLFGSFGMIAISLLLCLRAGLVSGKVVANILGALVAMAAVTSYLASDAVRAFEQRIADADDPIMRALTPITELISALEVSPIIGTGIGTNSNAAVSTMGAHEPYWLNGQLFELETARVAQEGGLIGFVLVYGTRVALIFLALGLVQRLRRRTFKALAGAIAAFMTLHLALFVINNPTGGLFFWFAAGLLLAMYRLENLPATMPAVDEIGRGERHRRRSTQH